MLIKILIIILALIILLGLIARTIIYLLKFKHEWLKRKFPNYKWHIERLHEKFILKEGLNRNILEDLERNKVPNRTNREKSQ